MAKVLKYAIGLDIAKDKFDACLAVVDQMQSVTIKSSKSGIANSGKGFMDLLAWVGKHLKKDSPKTFCMGSNGHLL